MVTFDRPRLTGRLAAMPATYRVLFSAAISERLFPGADEFFRVRDPKACRTLRLAIDLLWAQGAGARGEGAERDEAELACERLIRAAADVGTDDALFAENAASAIAYGLRAIQSPDPKEASWSAQCAYDSVDHFVLMEEADLHAGWSDEQILAHPVVQRELQRQLDDVATLESLAAKGSVGASDIGALRDAAQQQARTVFSAS